MSSAGGKVEQSEKKTPDEKNGPENGFLPSVTRIAQQKTCSAGG